MNWSYEQICKLFSRLDESNAKMDDLTAAILTLADISCLTTGLALDVDDRFAQKREMLKNRK